MTKLLCTFTRDLNKTLDLIQTTYNIKGNLYILRNVADNKEFICTYNVDNINVMLQNTVSIHRHGETNTLYTINALKTIGEDNIEWEDYRNSILITNFHGLKHIRTKLHAIKS